jgi:hypothetical protein
MSPGVPNSWGLICCQNRLSLFTAKIPLL